MPKIGYIEADCPYCGQPHVYEALTSTDEEIVSGDYIEIDLDNVKVTGIFYCEVTGKTFEAESRPHKREEV